MTGADRLVAACALNDGAEIPRVLKQFPDSAGGVVRDGGRLLAEFAGNDNSDGINRLLDLGVPVDARFGEGDGYWDVAPDSTALHVAAWRASHSSVRTLVSRGAPVNLEDGRGRTPLLLAVRACVDSYWMRRRKPDSIAILLDAADIFAEQNRQGRSSTQLAGKTVFNVFYENSTRTAMSRERSTSSPTRTSGPTPRRRKRRARRPERAASPA